MTYVNSGGSGSEPAQPVEPTVILRDEKRADGSHLAIWAYLDTAGRLHIDGLDLGPVTKFVSGDGEYENFKMMAKADIPRLIELLGRKPEDDILGLLGRSWTGDKSYDLEEILREGPIEVELATWSG
ncbi:MAG: hypothetical protein ACXW2M_04570 [Candidatus Aminicenantales bacterium]